MIPELRMIARLIRDIPSLIQRNSWRTFFKPYTISQLVFAYPLVKQNGRLLLLLSSCRGSKIIFQSIIKQNQAKALKQHSEG